ncbi:MAG: hypothetical protein ETSY1_36620 [Candidatus Entotheonella factor]|uniref:Uncharacterized protein n=1 Tax=Entotheonella factor TaxID=1429438 RepID=W4L8K5_ENTF1|nr:MAG: hypothetical protein ETSY1_36620 [Candidatus Entotheonella factor]
MRPLASPRNHENVKKAGKMHGDRFKSVPTRAAFYIGVVMRPLASPGNHEKAKKAGDRIQFCPLRKTDFFIGD